MRSFFDRIPALCCFCDQSCPAVDGICQACMARLERVEHPRCRCGLPMPHGEETPQYPMICGKCINDIPPYIEIKAEFVYSFPLSSILNHFKHRPAPALQRPLVHLFSLSAMDRNRPDALVPVPLHGNRRLRRGFNQAARLAIGLGKAMDVPVIHALEKCHAAPSQQRLSRQGRYHNLLHGFRCRTAVAGLNLAVVDDVVTTTATARATARTLLQAGAASVAIWALARTL